VIGDICRVKEKDLFPADLILLVSEHPEGNAFIETASLDGEKNLKPRNAYPETQRYYTE
jgi:P-type E1-E2 ATPase